MSIPRILLAVIVVYILCLDTTTQQNDTHDVSNWAKSREKRFLIFQTLGVHKFIISLAMPIDLYDRRAWRSLSVAWNFQWQHFQSTTVQHWWNRTYFPSRARSFTEGPSPIAQDPTDLSATFIYAMMEKYMDNKGLNGRECMHRAICENAQVHYVGGVVDRIYQRLLTPERHMEQHYHDSHEVEANGSDCFQTFSECPNGQSTFDQFVNVEDVVCKKQICGDMMTTS